MNEWSLDRYNMLGPLGGFFLKHQNGREIVFIPHLWRPDPPELVVAILERLNSQSAMLPESEAEAVETMPKTDQQIVDEVNEIARKTLRIIGTGYKAPADHKFYEGIDARSQKAWAHAVEIYESLTGTEVHDAVLVVQESPTVKPETKSDDLEVSPIERLRLRQNEPVSRLLTNDVKELLAEVDNRVSAADRLWAETVSLCSRGAGYSISIDVRQRLREAADVVGKSIGKL